MDRDPLIMSIWDVKHGSKHRQLPLTGDKAWSPTKQLGLCGCISDASLIDACRSQANLITTMSPPCQSWSRGGRGLGLGDSNGRAFLEALFQAFSLQTIAIAAECADDLAVHPHFKVIKALANALGYRLVWDQITTYQQMTSHARSRWLGVWVRTDAALLDFPFLLKLPMIPQMHWTDQACQFPIPQRWASQLRLSPSECQTYDSLEFLPPAKRSRYENRDLKTNEIIRSRVLGGADTMPTLCASYTRQHLLADQHLRHKGIFACLRETATGFQFFEPTLFCSLFGALEHIVLSEKLGSFLVVGNAISVPHALLALSIVFHCTSSCKSDPIGLVRKAWTERLTAFNAFVLHHEGFIHVIPKRDLWSWISERPVPCTQRVWTLIGDCVGQHVEFQVRSHQTVQQIFREFCTAPESLFDQLHARSDDTKVSSKSNIQQIACQESTFRLAIGNAHTGDFELRATFDTSLRTKVIDDSSSGAVPHSIQLDHKTIEDHINVTLFWAI